MFVHTPLSHAVKSLTLILCLSIKKNLLLIAYCYVAMALANITKQMLLSSGDSLLIPSEAESSYNLPKLPFPDYSLFDSLKMSFI